MKNLKKIQLIILTVLLTGCSNINLNLEEKLIPLKEKIDEIKEEFHKEKEEEIIIEDHEEAKILVKEYIKNFFSYDKSNSQLGLSYIHPINKDLYLNLKNQLVKTDNKQQPIIVNEVFFEGEPVEVVVNLGHYSKQYRRGTTANIGDYEMKIFDFPRILEASFYGATFKAYNEDTKQFFLENDTLFTYGDTFTINVSEDTLGYYKGYDFIVHWSYANPDLTKESSKNKVNNRVLIRTVYVNNNWYIWSHGIDDDGTFKEI